jgi:hypothetical protein
MHWIYILVFPQKIILQSMKTGIIFQSVENIQPLNFKISIVLIVITMIFYFVIDKYICLYNS